MKKKVTTLTLSIPKPCSENFDQMQPVPGGKYCDRCEKTIVDFRNYSDVAIARYYQRNKSKICGIFREDQLDTPIQLPNKISPIQRMKAIAALLSGLALTNISYSQQNVTSTSYLFPIENVDVIGNAIPLPISQPKLLRGIVTDKKGEILIGANVLLKGTSIGTITDIDGTFELKIDPKYTNFELEVSYTGFESTSQKFDFQSIEEKHIQFTLNEGVMLGEVVVMGRSVTECTKFVMGLIVQRNNEQTAESPKPIKIKDTALKVFPNPFSQHFTTKIKVPSTDLYLFNLYNINGQLVFSQVEHLTKGNNKVELRPKNRLIDGSYYLRVTNQKDFSESIQLVKFES